MSGSRTWTTTPTTVKGDVIGAGAGVAPPPANPIAVATDPTTGAAIIRQTAAPHEIAAGVDAAAKTIPADRVGNAQELAPLRGARGAPLTGAALVAAVGPKKAAEIEGARAHSTGGAPPATPPPPPVTAAGALSPTAQTHTGVRVVQRRTRPMPSTALPVEEDVMPTADDTVQLAEHLDADDVPLAPIQPHQKAASDTDSPSRGIPQPITDPGKIITGGFGELTDGQYHPLNGTELKALVEAMLDDVHQRIQDDLRFSMALTYPRVRARVSIVVEGIAAADGFAIDKVIPEPGAGRPGSTPLAVAATLGDQIVFVVTSRREEFNAAGESISPPNALREELGIEVPRKQRVETPTGYALVDRRV